MESSSRLFQKITKIQTNLLVELEKKLLPSKPSSEHTYFCEDYMKLLSVKLFEFFFF